MGKEKLQELRALLSPFHKKEFYEFNKYCLQIPKGSILQIYGPGKTEIALELFNEYNEWPVAWVEKTFSFYPPLLLQKKLSYEKFLFVESFSKNKDSTAQILLQILKSQLFKAVVVYHDHFDFKQLRRFQIFAEKPESVLIWLAPEKKAEWPVSTYIDAQKEHCKFRIQKLS